MKENKVVTSIRVDLKCSSWKFSQKIPPHEKVIGGNRKADLALKKVLDTTITLGFSLWLLATSNYWRHPLQSERERREYRLQGTREKTRPKSFFFFFFFFFPSLLISGVDHLIELLTRTKSFFTSICHVPLPVSFSFLAAPALSRLGHVYSSEYVRSMSVPNCNLGEDWLLTCAPAFLLWIVGHMLQLTRARKDLWFVRHKQSKKRRQADSNPQPLE